jgi:hypothetical protein
MHLPSRGAPQASSWSHPRQGKFLITFFKPDIRRLFCPWCARSWTHPPFPPKAVCPNHFVYLKMSFHFEYKKLKRKVRQRLFFLCLFIYLSFFPLFWGLSIAFFPLECDRGKEEAKICLRIPSGWRWQRRESRPGKRLPRSSTPSRTPSPCCCDTAPHQFLV